MNRIMAVRLASLACAVLLLAGSIMPAKPADSMNAHGPLIHVLAYFVFALLLGHAFRRTYGVLLLAGAMAVLYGLALETVQLLVPGRAFEFADVAWNGLGVSIAVLCCLVAFHLRRGDGGPSAAGHTDPGSEA